MRGTNSHFIKSKEKYSRHINIYSHVCKKLILIWVLSFYLINPFALPSQHKMAAYNEFVGQLLCLLQNVVILAKAGKIVIKCNVKTLITNYYTVVNSANILSGGHSYYYLSNKVHS